MKVRVAPKTFPGRRALGMIAASLISFSAVAHAADRSQDYRFEVVDQPVAVSAHSAFDVKLTKTSTGQPVANAEITRSRLEMTMTHSPHKSAVPGSMTTKMGCTAPGFSDTRRRYAASKMVAAAAIHRRLVSAGLR